jgi:hypothetical protein
MKNERQRRKLKAMQSSERRNLGKREEERGRERKREEEREREKQTNSCVDSEAEQ